MTINLLAKPSGTQGALQLNGVDAVVFDATGIVSGVNKSAVSQQPTLGTTQATTSGTSNSFTGIPSWVKKVTAMLNGVSTNGASNLIIQIGTGGTPATTGYSGGFLNVNGTTVSTGNLSTSIAVDNNGGAGNSRNGILTLVHMGSNLWAWSGVFQMDSSGNSMITTGKIQLAGALDIARVTTNGADTLDAGSWNILYE